MFGEQCSTSGLDNVIAALELNDRVREVVLLDLSLSRLELERSCGQDVATIL